MENETIAQRAERLLRQEIGDCVSGLVATLANMETQRGNANGNELISEAQELCTPVLDYEGAADDAGWRLIDGQWGHKDVNETLYDDAQTLCEEESLDPYEREVLEHWIVSRWLHDKLEAKGERVCRLDSLYIWGRTTSGQSIAIDSVIEDIARDALASMQKLES